MTSPIPNPRSLLTSLLNSLTINPQNSIQPPATDPPYEPPFNPLKNLPVPHRALLTTLHVLFPPPMLLQALDLLDRGLVTRISLQKPSIENPQQGSQETIRPPRADIDLTQTVENAIVEGNEEKRKVGEPGMYLVRSSQAPKGRFKDVELRDSSAITYTVRLGAWNCSCAAFTFSAFPGNTSWTTPSADEDVGNDWRGDGKEEGKEWEFGGDSFDGVDGGNVPVCKHLLASLLGEKWVGVLSGYVKDREVGRDELAGIGGEG